MLRILIYLGFGTLCLMAIKCAGLIISALALWALFHHWSPT